MLLLSDKIILPQRSWVDAIDSSDLVNAGINGIIKVGADARTLHGHILYIASKFLKTQFLFDSIYPVNLNADRSSRVNDCIDKVNEYIFKLSLRTKNLKLFDSLNFGLPHLKGYGLHLNNSRKVALSSYWLSSILIRLGIKKSNLSIKQQYRTIFYDFKLRAGWSAYSI